MQLRLMRGVFSNVNSSYLFEVIPQCIAHFANLPQAKLNSEINARFRLDEHGNLYFVLNIKI